MTARASILLLLTAVSLGAQSVQVPTPSLREPALVQARQLTAPTTAVAAPTGVKNPFAAGLPAAIAHPSAPAANVPAALADRQLLEKLAPLVSPSGSMQLGGESILLFGQKRIKVGDPLPITFDGQPYVLVISAIQGTSFTLRLNGEVTTRPIKPANRP